MRYVLEGSVRKAGNRVRITGQLIDTTTGTHIWADRFDGTLDDIFELQDQVASSVAGAIEPRLRLSEIERAARKPTANLTAYDLYLRALAESYRYIDEGFAEAVLLADSTLTITHRKFSNSSSPACAWPACRRSEPPCSRDPVAVDFRGKRRLGAGTHLHHLHRLPPFGLWHANLVQNSASAAFAAVYGRQQRSCAGRTSG